MVFNDTTDIENGLIQSCEFWTRYANGGISGDAILLKVFTGRLNRAFERIMPLLLAYNDQIAWDDLNHTDAPIGYIDITANQNDYKITVDENSLDILNIVGARNLHATGDTQYHKLERILANDSRVAEILNPNTATTGTPSGFLELGNRLYLDILPSSSVTKGIELTFQREHSYFASTDTTKEAGIPKIFHELLPLHASLDWNRVNRTDDRGLLFELKEEIAKQTQNLENLIALRNPRKLKLEIAMESNK